MKSTEVIVNPGSSDVAWAVERFGLRAATILPRLGFADAGDARVQEAVRVLAESGLVRPVVVGASADLYRSPGVDHVALDDPEWEPRIRELWIEQRVARTGVDPSTAAREEIDELLFLALGVRLGLAEAGVAGALSTSPSVIRAGLRGLGTATDEGLVCGAFVVGVGDELWTWADCSVVPDPDSEQLADIASAAARLHEQVSGQRPLVAFLSFSTAGSATHSAASKVQEALSLLRQRQPMLDADGEMQFDAAIDRGVGEQKFPGSTVAGRANVFVFPDLDAGNIAYKVAQRVGKAGILGSFVLGLRQPWVDLSRGCTTEEIVRTALAVAAMTNSREVSGSPSENPKEYR